MPAVSTTSLLGRADAPRQVRMGVRTPQVYVLSAYTAGRLHGEWIDAATDAEQIHADTLAMLTRSGIEVRFGRSPVRVDQAGY